jgi:hypothetical protein
MTLIHIAISDDWEACRPFGEYEVATRGIPLVDGDFVRATTPGGAQRVLDDVFGDLGLPLVAIVIDEAELRNAGLRVDVTGEDARIWGPLPQDRPAIVAETPIERRDGRWLVPDFRADQTSRG